jgi:glycosyltransferase involved in cell wall biosynthesis
VPPGGTVENASIITIILRNRWRGVCSGPAPEVAIPVLFHRFYDLFSGGGEVTILNMVRALPEWTHVLAYDRAKDTWLSDALQAAGNVVFALTTRDQTAALIEKHSPDAVIFHWYPPMSVMDIEPLPPSVRERLIVYSQWHRAVPYLRDIRKICFVSPWLQQQNGAEYPAEQTDVIINAVSDHFFDVQVRQDQPPSVGRHSRPVGLKFSSDIFQIYEGIKVPDLQVRMLGYSAEVLQARLQARTRLRKSWWLHPFNSMDVADFLSWVQVYVYKTHDTFTEACGICVAEAMAAGIPPVVENKGGLKSLVSNRETGFLCDTPQEMQAAATRLLLDRDLRIEMGEAARQWARDNLSSTVFRRNLLRLLV